MSGTTKVYDDNPPSAAHRGRWPRLVGTLLAVLLVAAACGNDSGEASGDDDATQSPGAEDTIGDGVDDADPTEACSTPSGEPIRIGVIGELQSFPGLADGVAARGYRANCEGGISGRPIEVLAAIDDTADPQTNLDGMKALVEQQGATAIVTTSTAFLPQSSDYLAEQQVPFSGWGFMPGFCEPNGWGFGFNGCLSGFAFGVEGAPLNLSLTEPIAELIGDDDHTVVIMTEDNEGSRGGAAQFHALWGDRVLAEEFVPSTVTDYTPYVNRVLEINPDAVDVGLNFGSGIAFRAALLGAGYEGVVFDFNTYIPGLLSADATTAAALEGGYAVSQFPPVEAGSEATNQVTSDLEDAGQSPFATQGAQAGYWSLDTLLQILAATAEAGDVDDMDLFAKVANEDGVDIDFALDGAPCPFSTLRVHVDPVPGAAVMAVEDGAYTVAVPFQCWGLQPQPD